MVFSKIKKILHGRTRLSWRRYSRCRRPRLAGSGAVALTSAPLGASAATRSPALLLSSPAADGGLAALPTSHRHPSTLPFPNHGRKLLVPRPNCCQPFPTVVFHCLGGLCPRRPRPTVLSRLPPPPCRVRPQTPFYIRQ